MEALEQDVGDEQGEHEVDDRRGVMLETVVERPVFAEGIEEIVLDIPPSVSEAPQFAGWQDGCGYRCASRPVALESLLDPPGAAPSAFRDGLFGIEDAYREGACFAVEHSLDIPASNRFVPLAPDLRLRHRDKPFDVIEERLVVLLKGCNDVLALRDPEGDHLFIEVQRVNDRDIEEPTVRLNCPLHETTSR